MTTYVIQIANIFNEIQGPIVIKPSYVNTKASGHTYLTTMADGTYSFVNQNIYIEDGNNNNLEIINANTVMARTEGSYTVFMHVNATPEDAPIPFSFYAFQPPFLVNSKLAYNIINQELPPIYKPSNLLNDIDNEASAGVIEDLYQYILELYFSALGTFGNQWTQVVDKETLYLASYNNNWELVYLGANGVLANTAHPNYLLEILITANTQISTQVFSIAIALSKVLYAIWGLPGVLIPVQVVYDDAFGGYLIKIYYDLFTTWILQDPVASILGTSTYLGGNGSYLWIIATVVERWMPAFVKWKIEYFSLAEFNANFDVADVTDVDFIAPGVIYDAYRTVSTNRIYNVQGFYLNE